MAQLYDVLVGMNYPDLKSGQGEVRREPGDVADDIPKQSVKALLAEGAIRPHEEPEPARADAAAEQPAAEPAPEPAAPAADAAPAEGGAS